MSGFHCGHPVPKCLVDRVFQGAATGTDRPHFGSEQSHAEHVELLARHVHLTHVDDALEAEEGGRSGGSHPVLACPGFGHESPLAHFEGEETLANYVVDLVAAGVVEVLAFQQDAHTQFLRQVGAFG